MLDEQSIGLAGQAQGGGHLASRAVERRQGDRLAADKVPIGVCDLVEAEGQFHESMCSSMTC